MQCMRVLSECRVRDVIRMYNIRTLSECIVRINRLYQTECYQNVYYVNVNGMFSKSVIGMYNKIVIRIYSNRLSELQ